MSKSHLLLYSGGVDSVLCLKLLRDCKITPTLLHFRTTKLTDEHEAMIMRNVERLSPDSPILVTKTKTVDYIICQNNTTKDLDEMYGVHMLEDKTYFYPAKLADFIYVGYYRINDLPSGIEPDLTPKDFDEVIDIFHANPKFRFPLEFFTRLQIDKLFLKLPKEVRADTISSTRGSAEKLGAKVVKEELVPAVEVPRK